MVLKRLMEKGEVALDAGYLVVSSMKSVSLPNKSLKLTANSVAVVVMLCSTYRLVVCETLCPVLLAAAYL